MGARKTSRARASAVRDYRDWLHERRRRVRIGPAAPLYGALISRHAADRWRQRVDTCASMIEAGEAIQRFLAGARLIDETASGRYLGHRDYPNVELVVVYNEGLFADQVITVNVKRYGSSQMA